MVERSGFEAAYLSGAGVAYTRLGRPDIGLVSFTETLHTLSAINDRVTLPLIVDADTGYGNALNTMRTVRELERAGAAPCNWKTRRFQSAAATWKARASCHARRWSAS